MSWGRRRRSTASGPNNTGLSRPTPADVAMIHVKLLNILAERSAVGRSEFTVDFVPGLVVRDVVVQAGLEESLVQIVILNGRFGKLDSPLTDGDQVMLSPFIAGG